MIRPATPGTGNSLTDTAADHNFVYSSWLQSYSSSEFALFCTPKDDRHTMPCDCRPGCGHRMLRTVRQKGITLYKAGELYWQTQRRIIARLLANCNVSVATLDDGPSGDGEMLDGFIVRDWKLPTLDYCYVRNSARGKGLAKEMLADLASAPAVEFTHASRGLDMARLPKGWTLNRIGCIPMTGDWSKP